MEASVIFPNQLFHEHPHLNKETLNFLVEEDSFFTSYNFHKKKLILHRASMKAFEDRSSAYNLIYVENDRNRTLINLFNLLRDNKVDKINLIEVLDFKLQKDLEVNSKANSIQLNISTSPGFLTEISWIKTFFSSHSFSMNSFYIAQRKRLGLLIENNKPVGGKWSYDPENRKRLPKDIEIPEPWSTSLDKNLEEAIEYVLNRFPKNPGDPLPFKYPIDHEQAGKSLNDFIKNRLNFFGDYQDSISQRSSTLFHSLLSSSFNIGLITPRFVLDEVLKANRKKSVPLNSLEGFIRQVIGWREYMRAVYLLKGREISRENFWGNNYKLPTGFYTAQTGLEPLDDVLRKVNQNAYAHHIERLMILGNFCLLIGINPKEFYRWLMEMFIDAYEWVMIPNVYGMSQYSDGGGITTKPYVSSSNYIRSMSDYHKGEWSTVWDSLFWSFIQENQNKIEKIPRMKVMLHNLKRKTQEELDGYNKVTNLTRENLFSI